MSVAVTQSDRELQRFAELLAEAERIRGVSLGRDAWRRLRKNWTAMAAMTFLALVGLLAVLTPLLPLQSPIEIDPSHRQFQPPDFEPLFSARLGLSEKADDPDQFQERMGQLFGKLGAFSGALVRLRVALFGDMCLNSICGTDELGRDLLARVFWGARVSLMVGLVATLVSLVIGVSYGAVSGYLGGHVDNLMMRVVDVLYSIPFIFVVIFVITILGDEGVKKELEDKGVNQLAIFYIVIGAIYWLTMARVVRGQVFSLKHEQFIEAARTAGAGRGRIIFLHLVPNLLSIVIVYLTLTIPSVMLFEAFLSFLGLGVSRPDVSWGLLANEAIRVITPIRIHWWLVVFPGLTLAMTLMALNFLGDGLRDALDPRLKHK